MLRRSNIHVTMLKTGSNIHVTLSTLISVHTFSTNFTNAKDGSALRYIAHSNENSNCILKYIEDAMHVCPTF